MREDGRFSGSFFRACDFEEVVGKLESAIATTILQQAIEPKLENQGEGRGEKNITDRGRATVTAIGGKAGRAAADPPSDSLCCGRRTRTSPPPPGASESDPGRLTPARPWKQNVETHLYPA